MNIPVVYEDETENEFDLELCCGECATKDYGWTTAQFAVIWDKVQKGEAIKLPDDVISEVKFKEFVKTL